MVAILKNGHKQFYIWNISDTVLFLYHFYSIYQHFELAFIFRFQFFFLSLKG